MAAWQPSCDDVSGIPNFVDIEKVADFVEGLHIEEDGTSDGLSRSSMSDSSDVYPELIDGNLLTGVPNGEDRRVRQLLVTIFQLYRENSDLREEIGSMKQQLQEAKAEAHEERRRLTEELYEREDKQWQAMERLRTLLQHLHTMLTTMVDLLPLEKKDSVQYTRALTMCWGQATPLTLAKTGEWDMPEGSFCPVLESYTTLIELGLHMLSAGYDLKCQELGLLAEGSECISQNTEHPVQSAGSPPQNVVRPALLQKPRGLLKTIVVFWFKGIFVYIYLCWVIIDRFLSFVPFLSKSKLKAD